MYKKNLYRISVLKALSPYLEKYNLFFLTNMILGILTLLLELLTPQIYKMFIDDIVLGGQFEHFKYVMAGYLLCFAITSLLGYAKYFFNVRYKNRFYLKIKEKMLGNLFSLRFDQYEKLDTSEAKMRIEDDVLHAAKYIDSQSINLVISYITLAASAAILFFIEWRLAIFSLITIPITIIADNKLSLREKKLNAANRINEKSMAGWLRESLQGWKEIKACCLSKYQYRKYNKYLYNYAVYYGKWINYWVARVLVIPKIKDDLFMQFGLYFFGGLLIINNSIEIGDVLVFAMYYDKVSKAIKEISGCDADLQASMPYTDRIKEELEKNSYKKTVSVPFHYDTIDFKNVSFTYPDAKNKVLDHITFSAHRGDRIAIMGPSGCGKTTLLKLATGMLSPTNGSVFYGGVDLKEVDIDELHQKIGYIMQENILINSTLRDNLLFGKEGASDAEILSACEKAYILELIKELPDGLDTIIGEKGVKLSGGQRQRIVLARLFLRSPEVYFFDEATSNLDPYSENFIHDALKRIEKDKIIIIASHRTSSLELCNKIIYMKKNSISDSDGF